MVANYREGAAWNKVWWDKDGEQKRLVVVFRRNKGKRVKLGIEGSRRFYWG